MAATRPPRFWKATFMNLQDSKVAFLNLGGLEPGPDSSHIRGVSLTA